ncbi:phosphotransferase [Sulfoacidibacillus thermotolerans]|uniref:Aminoglycoside phosphotransferase domain-containing protein n=1 Tax=Sulfoacidibacillus thermotolerans TaxID=1765684 RepID=A0A2U3DB89_SULT2|nr:phosphotransferase [Sulfoacidibacillus thermotolerans]PWI58551.1 hypothetical protein BM613_03280 [Sulfoacidibacillus thermotolerans]
MKPHVICQFLEHLFDLHCVQIDRIKPGVYRIVEKNGRVYGLKQMNFTRSRLEWMDASLAMVRKRGFTHYVWGTWHDLKQGSTAYLLMDWLPGVSPDPSNLLDLQKAAALLAMFHRAGCEPLVRGTGARVTFGTWKRQFQQGSVWLERARRENWPFLQGKSISLSAYRKMQKRAQLALDILQQEQYEKISRAQGVLCHGDSGPANFIMNKDDVRMIDFETLRIDLPSYDVFRMIRLAGKKNGWDLAAALAVVDGYERISPLSLSERQLVIAWLAYPAKLCKLLRAYGVATRGQRDALESRMAHLIKREEGLSHLVQQLRTQL